MNPKPGQLPLVRESVRSRDDLFLIRNFLSPAECQQWIAHAESSGFEQASVSTTVGQIIAPDVRNNDRLIWDDPVLAADWWQRAREFMPPKFGRWQSLGLNERFRFYRYRAGQRFAQHHDGSYQRSTDENSWLTLMVYLNDDYSGGTTRFDLANEPEPLVIEPTAGTALVFMHERLHEGAAVISGSKYVLRTDVMYRRLAPEQAAPSEPG